MQIHYFSCMILGLTTLFISLFFFNLQAEILNWSSTLITTTQKEVTGRFDMLSQEWVSQPNYFWLDNYDLAHLSASVKAVKSISTTEPQYFLSTVFNDARDTFKLQWLCNLHKNSNIFLMLLHLLLPVSSFSTTLQNRHNTNREDFSKKIKTTGIKHQILVVSGLIVPAGALT